MRQTEPPSAESYSKFPLFLIGKDSRGNWVVQDEQSLCGGLFVDRAEALKFAMYENRNRPQACVMVAGVFELVMSRNAATGHHLPLNTDAASERRVDGNQGYGGYSETRSFDTSKAEMQGVKGTLFMPERCGAFHLVQSSLRESYTSNVGWHCNEHFFVRL